MSMIEKIWNGSLVPVRHLGEGNQEMAELERLMKVNLATLENLLSEAAKETLRKYNLCVEEYFLVGCERSFHDGFCLGASITAEALTGAEAYSKSP